MYRLICTCLLILSFSPCGQPILLENVARAFANELKSNSSVVQIGTKLTGDTIADFADTFASFALILGRAFGNGQDIPAITKRKNTVDLDYPVNGYRAELHNEDAKLNIEELITKYGYPVEKHQVVTDDSYILSMFRIPSKGLPVFLMHGVTGSADDFIMAGPQSGLAYLLANKGFDVWFGNARGNKFSRRHAFLKPSDGKFWDFSWHEIGVLDLPAMIDHVLNVTNKKTLKYIGHSQGTTTFFVMASERPEYNKKIEIMIALSPVAFLSNTKTPVGRLIAPGTSILHALAKSTGTYEISADTKLTNILKTVLCGHGIVTNILCGAPLLLFFGVTIGRVNVTNLPVLIGHTPSGSSIKQWAHFGQQILSGKFRQFDYGRVDNLERYGSQEPPDYRLENIVAPVVLFYSAEDWLAQPKDVEKLAFRLCNVVKKFNLPMLNHMDFVLATDFKTYIFPKILRWLGKSN